jgi:hypothetical protein
MEYALVEIVNPVNQAAAAGSGMSGSASFQRAKKW